MLCQEVAETTFDRILIVQFGRLSAYYGWDADAETWVPCEELPPGFPPTVDVDPLVCWEPCWAD
jgi:hypothetical protein